MKHIITVALIVLTCITSTVWAQKDKKRASSHETVKNEMMSITYGRPAKKGRVIFGDNALVPYGKVWRTGADEATEITLNKPCMFGDKKVEAGTYTLFTIPGKSEWTVILNKKLGQWGAFGYEQVKDQNVLETTVKAEQQGTVTEVFTIEPKKEGIRMSWDNTTIFIPVRSI